MQSKYSPTSQGLSHSHAHKLGFDINPSLHRTLSINSLHSHLHLSLFQGYLSLQTLASNLHLYTQVPYHDTLRVSLVLDARLNTLIFMSLTTSGTHDLL